jgi:hypothetical protein
MQSSTTSLSNLDFALNYACEWNWAVFPLHSIATDGFCTCGESACKSEGKHPRTKNGCLNASKDASQINAWWAQWPEANIGIATGQISGIVVLDIDVAKGARNADLIFGKVDQTVFTTPKVKTGGGLHFYYKYPAGHDIRNSASKLGKFIDVRGEGGYVVAPPSKHITGKQYEFLNAVAELAEFPDEWIAKLITPVAHSAPVNGNGAGPASGHSPFVVPPASSALLLPDAINQGKRNMELTKIAGSLRRIGLSENAIFSALAIENQRICKPPLEDAELHHIARSVARYKPQDVLNQISDPDAATDPDDDYENTLKPYLFGDFLQQQFTDKEILGFHIGQRDIAIIQAATNAGKTTLLRNIGLCMAAGRPFMPFFEGIRPVKIAYFDFENDAQDVQRDLKQMFSVFTPTEARLLEKNCIVIPKGLMDGELFQFNTHEKWANALIQQNGVEFIIVDNVSAAYDLNDENSNAEVTKKVIKPLLKMAYRGNCAFLFAHHYGKAKTELDHAGVHAGRGASALQALSRTVINMFGDVSKGEAVTVECAKRKTDGGQNYREVFRLEDDRWFHHTTIAPPPKKPDAYFEIRDFVSTFAYPTTVSTAEVIDEFQSGRRANTLSVVHIKRTLKDLYDDGYIDRPSHGQYCAKPTAVPATPAARNFYEKDED